MQEQVKSRLVACNWTMSFAVTANDKEDKIIPLHLNNTKNWEVLQGKMNLEFRGPSECP